MLPVCETHWSLGTRLLSAERSTAFTSPVCPARTARWVPWEHKNGRVVPTQTMFSDVSQ